MADTSQPLPPDEIQSLLKSASGGASDASAAKPASSAGIGGKPTASGGSPNSDANNLLTPNDIEALFQQSAGVAAATPQAPVAAAPRPATTDPTIQADDIELLLRQAEAAIASVDAPNASKTPAGIKEFKFEEFMGAPPSQEAATIQLLRDVELDLKIELGRTHMHLEDVLRLRRGSVVALDKLAGDPVDIYVNGRLIARGEVLVLNDNFCVRVAELVASDAAG